MRLLSPDCLADRLAAVTSGGRLDRLAAALLLALASACGAGPTIPGPGGPIGPDPDVVPPIVREFRGLWTATVANIDWPSRAGLTAGEQRAELQSIMDRAKSAGMNAIVLHVRPAGDALYRSPHEPWGRMLTGTQGVDPGYDPLEFAVAEAHQRGLELHAWVNPFRAGNTADSSSLAPLHLFHTRRDLVRVYGSQLWMDPGESEVHDHSMRVIRDIVARYDVDAVHLDDYFYPYPQSAPGGGTLAFPDAAAYARDGGSASLGDWRRANVDRFLERLYGEVHAEKPWVRVGISPFGIWRPGNPAGIAGLDAYSAIYADARKWIVNGWLDYLAPQLYWAIDPPAQSYTALLGWWQQQNPMARFVWPGIATYKLYEGTPRYTTGEVVNQVKAARDRRTGGVLFYNTTTTITRNGGEVASALKFEVFGQPALSPATTWLDATVPPAPTITGVSTTAGWRATLASSGEPVRFYHVRYRAGTTWTTQVISGSTTTLTLPSVAGSAIDWVVVNAIDRVGNASPDATWRN
ncbi:MAG: family 10 glycosylhydrolase [Gemmatimonadaceae bacterium]|nr:family 10 glycosylhydrolase [Gemmatimonadaceae bacterium]